MGDPAFCGAGSGCMAVRFSPYSSIGGVHLPLIGLLLELGLLVLALVARDRDNTFFVAAAAAGGGLVALGLMGIMAFKLGTLCKWCLLVDGSTLVAAGAAAWVYLEVLRDPSYVDFLAALSRRRAQVIAWIAVAFVVVGLPRVWGEYPVVPPLPPEVAAAGAPGKPTIVAFTDFQCPFCRKLAPVLHEVQENWGDRVALVRKMAPLPMHPGAMSGALAYVCTPDAQREEMAKRLYAAPDAVLTRPGVTILARDLHVDEEAFARCLESAAAREKVLADKALFDALELHALPYTFIGRRSVRGGDVEQVRKYGAEIMDAERPSLPLWWMVAIAGALAAGLVALTLKLTPRDPEPRLAGAP